MWYMTVGVPGGEYAAQAEHLQAATDFFMISGVLVFGQVSGSCIDGVFFRPCPPDLAEWLDAKPHCLYAVNGGFMRQRVPGGWQYISVERTEHPSECVTTCSDHTSQFIPVAGAAGITVIEAKPDAQRATYERQLAEEAPEPPLEAK
jgi:hypothetical protein